MLHRLFLTDEQAQIICRALRCYRDAVLQPEFDKFVNEHDHFKAEKINDMMDLSDAVLEVLTDAD